MSRDHIEHVPVVGPPPEHPHARAIVVFDAETGKLIGSSPHVLIEQTRYKVAGDVVTTTLKITPLKPEDADVRQVAE